MRKYLGAVLLTTMALGLTVGFGATGQAQAFTLCKSTFALCTIAPCTPIAGTEVACRCTVHTGYSASQKPCQSASATAKGQPIRSRYYPVKSYVICDNDRPWAWCLDKPCTVSKNDPNAATCTCDSVKNQGPYVIVTSHYTEASCTTGIISSATVTGITQITDFLKKNAALLVPFPIQVLGPPQHG
ncbi:MAG TPA: hypothetical protein VMF62_18900 [Acetobacteraceae bacterium]|jgi:hypothetical protein|nr:hypothetical protein [Acetobacteraceae bacterium]